MIGTNNHAYPTKTICFFVGSISGKGGTERVATIVANGLSKLGHSVKILSLWEGLSPTYELAPNIQLAEIFPRQKKFKWSYLFIVKKLKHFVKTERIDVLISVDVFLSFYTSPALWGMKTAHVAWEHFNYYADLGLRTRRLSRFLAAKTADAVIVLTNQDAGFWRKEVKGRAQIHVISNPVTYTPINPENRSWKNKVAVAIGRLTWQKGFDLLISSWEIVNFKCPDWKLLIVGEGEDEMLLKELISKKNLDAVVQILPFNSIVASYYQEASIYCLPSRFEGLPMVLLEAQAYGLPSVCFNCITGPSDIIYNGLNGLLIAENDEAAFAEGIIQLAEDEQLRKKMGINAITKAGRFEEKTIIDKWHNFLTTQINF